MSEEKNELVCKKCGTDMFVALEASLTKNDERYVSLVHACPNCSYTEYVDKGKVFGDIK